MLYQLSYTRDDEQPTMRWNCSESSTFFSLHHQLHRSSENYGSGFELAAIAAVVIGGTSLMGSRGSVINSLFGVLVIAVLENGLAQLGASESVKR